MTGSAAMHSFERLAAWLISEMARRWWTLEVPCEVADFGEILLRHAQQDAQAHGKWTYRPDMPPAWADVTVTYHPTDRGKRA
ncbi:hypothetical protein ACIQI7_10860 [Kitasatospora sp. NPDC092039]|uniref:hypothetical protein n=1 Tax=Kitasatospora sp. NPDC092039 TaxID=3364086 RepID=UPI0037F195BA